MANMSRRIIVTGGSGKNGRYIIESLLSKRHQALNLDLSLLPNGLDQQIHTLK